MIKDNALNDRLFRLINGFILTMLLMLTLLPFLQVVAKAFSSDSAIMGGHVLFWPIEFHTNALRFVMANGSFLQSFLASVYLTLLGTAVSMLLSVLTGYPLSKTRLKGKKWLLLFFVFTMLFSGGLVPNYILRHRLGLLDSLWAVILPGLSVYFMLLFKNFCEGIPDSLEESAMVDGASNMRILFSIYLPLCRPVIATLSLFYAVGFWNSYFGPMIYITSSHKQTLQMYLRSTVYMASLSAVDKADYAPDILMNICTESVVAATVVAATVPILVLYPFLQKYFVKGVVLGSVKE